MNENFTPQPTQSSAHPFADQLARHGVPESIWPYLTHNGVGELVEKLQIVFTEFSPQRLSATMPVAGNTQVYGILHGGASAALAETLGSMAAAPHGAGTSQPVGVDLNITHHKAGRSGVVTAQCTPVHLGARKAHAMRSSSATMRASGSPRRASPTCSCRSTANCRASRAASRPSSGTGRCRHPDR
ncbi:PaaI family thioesterase [Glutamicibacter halophytocola]|uniref:PaaI family thioesterase n=1 Tax=Glutamicibacter halophytocola TaxID=1933880 RepID=UPI00321BD17A